MLTNYHIWQIKKAIKILIPVMVFIFIAGNIIKIRGQQPALDQNKNKKQAGSQTDHSAVSEGSPSAPPKLEDDEVKKEE